MRKIRTGVFETNSSSTHSIHIDSNTELFDNIVPDKDGAIILQPYEFGWQWEKFSSAYMKLTYLMIYAINNDNLKILEKVVKDHTGAKSVIIESNGDDYNPFGYIDHQSVGNLSKLFNNWTNEDEIRNFIFNPKSILYLGNDNDYSPPNFYDRDVEYKYELIIEGLGSVTKFEEYPSSKEIHEALVGSLQNIKLFKKGTYYPNEISTILYDVNIKQLGELTIVDGDQLWSSGEDSYKFSNYEGFVDDKIYFQSNLINTIDLIKEHNLLVEDLTWEEKGKLVEETLKKNKDKYCLSLNYEIKPI